MHLDQNKGSVANAVILLLVFINAGVLEQGLVSHAEWYPLLYITVPLLMISIVFKKA
jgi:hypothetical protein